ncbi:MAG TPA: hypothetical protein VGC20_03455 [bacterium]
MGELIQKPSRDFCGDLSHLAFDPDGTLRRLQRATQARSVVQECFQLATLLARLEQELQFLLKVRQCFFLGSSLTHNVQEWAVSKEQTLLFLNGHQHIHRHCRYCLHGFTAMG